MYQLVNDLAAAWNSHDVERVLSFYAPDYVGSDVAQAALQHGWPGIRQMLTRYWLAFPDLCFRHDEVVIAEDKAALAWTARGTHQGRLMNIPATGRAIEVQGISLLTISGGKVTQAQYIWDVAGLLRMLGLLPDL